MYASNRQREGEWLRSEMNFPGDTLNEHEKTAKLLHLWAKLHCCQHELLDRANTAQQKQLIELLTNDNYTRTNQI